MRIQVTQKHIDKGFRGSCGSDPIGLAMKDAGLNRPWVSPDNIQWEEDGQFCSAPTPDSLLEFMRIYDNQGFVVPFEFELEGE